MLVKESLKILLTVYLLVRVTQIKDGSKETGLTWALNRVLALRRRVLASHVEVELGLATTLA